MSSEKDPRSTIIDLIQSAARKATRPARIAPARKVASAVPASSVIHIGGDGNIVAYGDVHQTTHHHHAPARPKVVVKTGDGVIDAQQKAEIKALVGAWVDAHGAVKRTPLTWGGAWAAFNRAMKVNSYAELRPDQMPEGRAWLQKQVAMINAMPSAARKRGDRWRTDRIAAIKARSKTQLGDERAYAAYIQKNFGKTSLAELTDIELERVYRYILAK